MATNKTPDTKHSEGAKSEERDNAVMHDVPEFGEDTEGLLPGMPVDKVTNTR